MGIFESWWRPKNLLGLITMAAVAIVYLVAGGVIRMVNDWQTNRKPRRRLVTRQGLNSFFCFNVLLFGGASAIILMGIIMRLQQVRYWLQEHIQGKHHPAV